MITITDIRNVSIKGSPVGALVNAFQESKDPVAVQIALEAYCDGLIADHAAQIAALESTHAEAIAAKDAEMKLLAEAYGLEMADRNGLIAELEAAKDGVTQLLADAEKALESRDAYLQQREAKITDLTEINELLRIERDEAGKALAQSQAETQGVYQFRDALLHKLEATGGDPEKVAEVAKEALGTLEDKRRAAALAEVEKLEAEVAARKAELGLQ